MSQYTPPPQYPNQDQEPINLTESIVQDPTPNEDDDLFMKSIMQRKDTQIRSSLINSLKNLKPYPVFGDKEMAKISINYYLYLEFFHVAIRMFGEVFIFSAVAFAFYLLIYAFASEDTIKDVKLCYNLFNGVIAVFLLKRARNKQETRILNEEMLYNFQWSEDLFSVLVEGLPLDVNQDEVNFFFKSIFAKEAQVCRVVDVMFIHNYRELVPLKNKLAQALLKQQKFQTDGERDLSKVVKLNQEIEILEEKIAKYTEEITQGKHFGGKAIVIFETVENQNQVVRFFTYGWIKSLLIFSLRSCCFQQHYLRGHRIRVQQVAEPRDMLFENLHCSSFENAIRNIISYSFSTSIICLALYLVFFNQNLKKENVKELLKESKLASYVIAFCTTLLAFLLERAYGFTQGILMHKSTLEAKKSMIFYSLYIAFFIYCGTQAEIALTDLSLFANQLLRVSMFFTLKTLLFKTLEVYSSTTAVQHASEHASGNSILNSIATKAQNAYQEFNFVKGVALAYPPLLIGSAYFCADPLTLLPPLIIILYAYAMLDKFRLIRGSKLFISKSASFMLTPFTLYRYIPLISFSFNLGLVEKGSVLLLTDSNRGLYNLGIIVGAIGFFGSLCCPRPLNERVKEKFVEKNALVTYQSVSHEFSSVFRKEDPFHKKNFLTKSQKV